MANGAVVGVEVLDRAEQFINTSFLRFIRFLIFPIGLSCMIVAGYLLIQGFQQIGGDGPAKNMWVVLGILFQVGESACFVSAAAFTHHSVTWRYSALGVGLLLFLMSIGVMTLAQKTAMFAGETKATAIDQQRTHIQAQIDSLEELIASYRLNAEKQSQSIYAQSRRLGQESLNKAVELEEKKLKLSNQLFTVTTERQQTSLDFFVRIETMFGYDAHKTEFAFFVARSVFVEGLGIFLMALGAHQYSRHSHLFEINAEKAKPVVGNKTILSPKSTEKTTAKKTRPRKKKTNHSQRKTPVTAKSGHEDSIEISEMMGSRGAVVSFPTTHTLQGDDDNDSGDETDDLARKIIKLHEQNKIRRFGRDSIRRALTKHFEINIGSTKAGRVADRVKVLLQ